MASEPLHVNIKVPVGAHLSVRRGAQLFGVVKNAVLHVTSVAAQLIHLFSDRGDNARMAMPHRHHVVVGIRYSLPSLSYR